MNTAAMIQQLKAQREQIDTAISALEALDGKAGGRGRGAAGRRGPRVMSAEARRRISEAMRKRWAERKKKA